MMATPKTTTPKTTTRPTKSQLDNGALEKIESLYGSDYLTSVNPKFEDIKPAKLQKRLDEYYASKESTARVIGAILNAIFHERKPVFYLSQAKLAALLVTDSKASASSLSGKAKRDSLESMYTRVTGALKKTGLVAEVARRKIGKGKKFGTITRVFALTDKGLLTLFLKQNPGLNFTEILQSFKFNVSELTEAGARLLADANVVAAPVLLVESVREALFTAEPTYALPTSESAPPAVVVVEEEEPEVKWVPAPRRTPEQDRVYHRVYHQAFNDITTDLSKTLGLSREIIEERLAEAEKCISGELGAADSGLVITKLRRRMSDFYRPTITKNLLPCQK